MFQRRQKAMRFCNNMRDLMYLHYDVYYKPVVVEVFKAENVQQTNRKSDVFGVIRRWFVNGTVDFLHNPHKHSSIDGLHTEKWLQLYTWVYSIWHQTVKPTFSCTTFTKASLPSTACAEVRGLDTLSLLVIKERRVKLTSRASGATCKKKKKIRSMGLSVLLKDKIVFKIGL